MKTLSCAALSEEHLGHSDSGSRRTSRWRRVRLCLKVEGVKHSGSRHPGRHSSAQTPKDASDESLRRDRRKKRADDLSVLELVHAWG